jgi:hypothetical protein
MTWHKPAVSSAVALQMRRSAAQRVVSISLGMWLAACGSSSKNATIEITSPSKGEVLTSKDDTDTSTAGLQFKLTAASTDVAPGTDVSLRIEGEKNTPITKVGRDGEIVFDDVTLPRGKRTLKVMTGNGGIQSADDWDYTHKALLIDSPLDGRVISSEADDKDPDLEGVQINVLVKTFAIDMSEDVVLQVDLEPAGRPLQPNGSETLSFTGVTLSNGEHTLKAVSGQTESDPVRISVNPTCANVNFVQPMVPSDGTTAVELGGEGMCPAEGEQFKTDFVVSTDAGDGRNLDLYVNGTFAASGRVAGTVVTFKDIVLDRYNTSNDVEVVVETAQNVECQPFKYPVGINLDCEGVDCSISAPRPRAGNDADGNRVQYLNSSYKKGDGFDFDVHTDAEAIGRPVKLIIDGRETDAPTADPSGSDPDVKALFTGIELADGEHTIAARCEHESGTFGLSREAKWIVDTRACGVDIQQPTADTLLVPGFDADSNLSGVQIELESSLDGDDCSRARTAPCNPDDGIANEVGYEDIDGQSPLSILVTLANEAEQNLCLDVQDRAGNVGSDSVAVRYRPEAPKLLIENPKNQAKFNARGGNGFEKDSDTGSATVCNANFDVACSELGASVRLHRDDANGAVFGMANCEPKGNNDPALPGGYAGRARIRNAAFLSGNNDTVTVVATQSGGSASLVGESPAITLKGDCEVPALTFTGESPCGTGQLGVADQNGRVTKDIVVADGTADTQKANLTVTAGSESPITAEENVNNASYTFNDVMLGGPGTGRRALTIAVTAKDDYENEGRASCDTAIVFDLPVLTVTTPAANAYYTTAISPSVTRSPQLCSPPGGGEGLQIVATSDAAQNRTASVSVKGGTAIALPLSDVNITACVPIDPGPNELVFRLVSSRTTAFDEETITINLVTALPNGGVAMDTNAVNVNRGDKARLRWTAPNEQFPGQYVGYQVRCGTRPFPTGGDEAGWWDRAHRVTLPADLAPPTNEVEIDTRAGEESYCLVRAADAAGNLSLTAGQQSVPVKSSFRVSTGTISGSGTDTALGLSLVGVGDVNGDGIDDLLAGGFGRARLIFGRSDAGWNGSGDVTFEAGNGASESYFGETVVALGDFNGDGPSDFAITEQQRGASGNGRVFVFFGRGSGDAWPSTVTIGDPPACGADICFTSGIANGYLGYSASSAGDFNGDSRPDLAVSSVPNLGDPGESRLYVLLGGNTYASGSRSGDFYGAVVPVDSGTARRGFVFTDTVESGLGASFVPVGNVDGTAGDDLIVGAPGDEDAVNGAIYLASGRPYIGPELQVLPPDQLGYRNNGTPTGTPIDTASPTAGFGAKLYVLGNAYNLAGGMRPNAVDIAVYRPTDNSFVMYPGENNFAPADRVRIAQSAGGGSYFGTSVCQGVDLDGDGLTEVCAAGRYNLMTSAEPGEMQLFYGDNLGRQVTGTTGSDRQVLTDASSLVAVDIVGDTLQAPTNQQSGQRVVNFVGDLNDDGQPDLAVATPSANSSAGELKILY